MENAIIAALAQFKEQTNVEIMSVNAFGPLPILGNFYPLIASPKPLPCKHFECDAYPVGAEASPITSTDDPGATLRLLPKDGYNQVLLGDFYDQLPQQMDQILMSYRFSFHIPPRTDS